jgi:hypothetical protein
LEAAGLCERGGCGDLNPFDPRGADVAQAPQRDEEVACTYNEAACAYPAEYTI